MRARFWSYGAMMVLLRHRIKEVSGAKRRGIPVGVLGKPLFIIALGMFLGLATWAGPCLAETAVIPMQYRSADEALPMVRQLLSPEGRAVADGRTNRLLVVDEEEAIRQVRAFLEGFDRPGKQARIRVRFEEANSGRSTAVQGKVRTSGDRWSVSLGKPIKKDGAEIHFQDGSRSRQGSAEFFLSVVSGSPAYMMVGQDIIYNQRWADLTRRYAGITESVTIQRIETGFEVKPVILKAHAEVEIIPRISRGGPGSRVIQFTEASTRLSAPLGEWVTIGGASRESNEVIRAILEAGRGNTVSMTSISLLVEANN